MREDEFSKAIKGMVVLDAELSQDQQNLTIHTIREGVKYRLELEAWGDCCARPWIESVNDLADLKFAKLQSWAHESHQSDSPEGYDVLDYDFYKFVTDKGYVDIELRTSHNGYYGGDLLLHIFTL